MTSYRTPSFLMTRRMKMKEVSGKPQGDLKGIDSSGDTNFWNDREEILLLLYRNLLLISSITLLFLIVKILSIVKNTILIIAISLFLTYLLLPAVNYIERKLKIHRLYAVALIYLSIFFIAIGLGLSIIPVLSNQLNSFLKDFPNLFTTSLKNLSYSLDFIIKRVNMASPTLDLKLEVLMKELYSSAIDIAKMLPAHTFSFFLNTFVGITEMLIVLVITFYLLKDYSKIVDTLKGFLTPFNLVPFFREFEDTLSGFIRGQVIAALYVFSLVTFTLTIMRVKYSLIIGVLSGIFELIPFLGAFIGFALSALVSFSRGLWVGLLVTLTLAIGYQVLAKVIYPNVVGKILKVSPVIILLGIVLGAELGGVVGMFLAVPIIVLVKRWIMLWLSTESSAKPAS